MGTLVIPVRVTREILEAVDKLVELGVFSSRSEALRELIKAGLRRYEDVIAVAAGVEKLFEIEKETGEIPIRLDGALEELLRERRSRG